jgi:hypothetical protein
VRAKKKSELKLEIREQAKRKVRPTASNVGADRRYREHVEAGRQELNRLSAEGGDPKAKRIRNELTYLLNNYLPSYDIRIEQLIDAWRRTGDPTYDPGIRMKLRQARREHMDRSSAI